MQFKRKQDRNVLTRNLSNLSLQVFLLLVKRLASLHYNHPESPQDSNLKSLVAVACETEDKKSIKASSLQTINNCRTERDNNTNRRSKTFNADYDEVDFQSTSDCNYKDQINETINKSSRTEENMGSNVSTAGGKGLSGRRTQSSSKSPTSSSHVIAFSSTLNIHSFSFDPFDLMNCEIQK